MAKVEGVELKLMSLEDFTSLDESTRAHISWALSIQNIFISKVISVPCYDSNVPILLSHWAFFPFFTFPLSTFHFYDVIYMCDVRRGWDRFELLCSEEKIEDFSLNHSFPEFDFFFSYVTMESENPSELEVLAGVSKSIKTFHDNIHVLSHPTSEYCVEKIEWKLMSRIFEEYKLLWESHRRWKTLCRQQSLPLNILKT